MGNRLKFVNALIVAVLFCFISAHTAVLAKSASAQPGKGEKQRYIIIFEDQPLATYDGRLISTPEREFQSTRLAATANRYTGARKLDVNSPISREYLQFLDERFKTFRGEALLRLGRQLQPLHRYRIAINGFAAELSAAEMQTVKDMPGVKAVLPDEIQHLETDSGPIWIGADKIHMGSVGYPATGGQGTVVGLIDSGINWDHSSFADPGLPGWDHVNPYGVQLGLCSKPEVQCNDKLVGVYEFVTDDPGTVEVEESTDGKDNAGHGSHVGSIAVGNPLSVTLSGVPSRIGGVAPNANIISYRVCYIADPDDPDDDGCQTSAIFSAIDQAISDGVDVINYSIGGSSFDPWLTGSTPLAFLNARAAGIFVATSAGNAGPNPGTIGSPANAPWIMAVGNATHDRVLGSIVENLRGGDTTPPNDLVGASFTGGIETRTIVHARDYGFPLCGLGPPELGPECSDNSGASNPFVPNTFNGQIVVCDRGDYGRVEKGKNLMLAGAGGYILANSVDEGDAVVADDHCLPSTHINYTDGNKLRTWLDSGTGHQGNISGFSLFHIPEAGDVINRSSSRGPNLPPAEDVMKPDVIAPGTLILGAGSVSDNFLFLTGTSMSSPHVTGGAALLKSVHPDWTPSMLASAITMTATPELASDHDGSLATIHKRGAGRPRLDLAVNAGLSLEESRGDFLMANPRFGGKPRDLNLPGLVDAGCRNSCGFQRTVTDLAGGASWKATANDFAAGVVVTVTPANFTLTDGAEQLLTIIVDLSDSEVVGSWVYGEIQLSSTGLPEAVLPVAVFADGGSLPTEWSINSNELSGWKNFTLSGLAALPDATYTSGGLVEPTKTVVNLPQDPTNETPYDGPPGVHTVWLSVPENTLWLHTETLESVAEDLDLFVGLDVNGDGIAQESEELCASISPTELELCDLFTPVAGEYWVIVQNWSATGALDEVTFETAVVHGNALSHLGASGDGIVAANASQEVRLSWDNVNATPGSQLIGAVGIGTRRETPNNIGIIPVRFNKFALADPQTLVLMNGINRGVSLRSGGMHDRIFVDVPPGVDRLTLNINGEGGEAGQNLGIKLYRQDFADAFTQAPLVVAPDTSGSPLVSALIEDGPLTVSGEDLVPGRWFVVLKNKLAVPAAFEIRAEMAFADTPFALQAGLWEPTSRADLRQGIDFTTSGDYRALLWYSFDEDGNSSWYQAAAPVTTGNVWVAPLNRYTNDGNLQQSAEVGHVSVTMLSGGDSVFSFVLFGEEGSDRMAPISPPTCPETGGVKKSYTGIWSRTNVGIGGASVLVNGTSQGYVHYIYDSRGRPVWLTAADATDNLPNAREMSMLQWTGFCAACTGPAPTYQEVGVFTRDYMDENNMTWNLDYMLNPPLSGSANRSDVTAKLTTELACQ